VTVTWDTVRYQTPHYEGYPWVLVRLGEATGEEVRDVLTEAWLFTAPMKIAAAFEREEG
jgi:hypothetical protein